MDPLTTRESVVAKVFLVLSALVITILPLIPTVNEYAVSLYTQIPMMLRIGAGILVAGSVATSLIALAYERNQLALYVLSPILTLSAIFPFIPKSLGYIVKYSDQMNHVGTIRDILATGTIPDTIYPGLHILSTTLVEITGLSAASQLAILATISVALFSCISYLLARYSHVPPASVLLFVPFVIVANSTVPSKFTYGVVFPLVLFIAMKLVATRGENTRLFVAFIPILAASWMYHIVPAIIATGSVILVNLHITQWHRVKHLLRSGTVTMLVFLSGLFGYLWTINTRLFENGILMIAAKLVTSRNTRPSSLNTASLAATLFGDFGLSPTDVVVLALRQYGGTLIVCSTAGLGVILYLSGIGPDSVPRRYRIPPAISAIIIGSGLWSVAEITVGLIARLNFTRVLRPAVYGGIVASGSILYITVYTARRFMARDTLSIRSVGSVGVGMVIILLVATPMVSFAMVSYQSTYYNPDTFQANRQILPSDIEGMGWYFEYKDKNIKTSSLWRLNYRYVRYMLPPAEQAARSDELDGEALDRGYRAPAHFGYRNNSTFAQSVGCRYYIEGDYDRASYLKARPNNKFTRADFRRLRADTTIQRVYSNGNINVSKVKRC